MRRMSLLGLAVVLLGVPVAGSAQNQPPHAWLFGTWTGGLFPPVSGIGSQACFSQPVVVFTRDLVLRATLTEQALAQREIETARATPQGVEFRFAVTGVNAVSPMFGGTAQRVGFGCESPDLLRVQRRGENEISFPGCAEFPYPLVRCQTR